jgi:hypothetical protein
MNNKILTEQFKVGDKVKFKGENWEATNSFGPNGAPKVGEIYTLSEVKYYLFGAKYVRLKGIEFYDKGLQAHISDRAFELVERPKQYWGGLDDVPKVDKPIWLRTKGEARADLIISISEYSLKSIYFQYDWFYFKENKLEYSFDRKTWFDCVVNK